VAELHSVLPKWTFVDEAYYHLLEEGYEFGPTPTIDDVESQLRRSIDLIEAVSDPNVVFERCPVDYLAYLTAFDVETETLGYWFQESRDALASLDAVIFVPIERPDRIVIGTDDLPKLRHAVDVHLRNGLVEDYWGLDVIVHESYGSPANRVAQVLSWINPQEVASR
jgi:hypothetical protein